MKCKDCVKWIYPHKDYNGTYGRCSLTFKWYNEYYNCIIPSKQKEGRK